MWKNSQTPTIDQKCKTLKEYASSTYPNSVHLFFKTQAKTWLLQLALLITKDCTKIYLLNFFSTWSLHYIIQLLVVFIVLSAKIEEDPQIPNPTKPLL